MVLIILKIVICSFVLLGFYHFFLAKERFGFLQRKMGNP